MHVARARLTTNAVDLPACLPAFLYLTWISCIMYLVTLAQSVEIPAPVADARGENWYLHMILQVSVACRM